MPMFSYFSAVASIDRPEHVHISLGEQDSMVVMWSTRLVTGGIVQYGVTPKNMTLAVPSSIASLPEEYVKANPYIYRVELKVKGDAIGLVLLGKFCFCRHTLKHCGKSSLVKVTERKSSVYNINTITNLTSIYRGERG